MIYNEIRILRRYAQICQERGGRIAATPPPFFNGHDSITPAMWFGRAIAANAVMSRRLKRMANILREI